MQKLSRLEEAEKNHIETTKRRFFAEILNTVRELQLQIQASLKRRKQRNDGVQVQSFFLYLSFVIVKDAIRVWQVCDLNSQLICLYT